MENGFFLVIHLQSGVNFITILTGLERMQQKEWGRDELI